MYEIVGFFEFRFESIVYLNVYNAYNETKRILFYSIILLLNDDIYFEGQYILFDSTLKYTAFGILMSVYNSTWMFSQ